jgi:thioester reductase-like protein
MEDLVIHVKSKDIRLGIVRPIYLPKYGGSSRHTHEILTRLVKAFNNISLFPSSDIFLVLNDENDKEQVLKIINQYRKLGFKILETFDHFWISLRSRIMQRRYSAKDQILQIHKPCFPA